jgi:prophage maintenance system killer protein
VIALQVADLVLVASRVLDVDTDAVLDMLDVDAAETALAAAALPESLSLDDPARPAAALLSALLRHRPLRHGNEQVALVATAQFLALNGFTVDLDSPEQARSVVDDVAAGRLEPAELAVWLAARLRLHEDATMQCGNESFLWRWLPTRRRRPGERRDPFHRFTDRARMVVVLAQDEARRLGHNYIGTEHVLLGLIGMGDGVAAKVLEVMGITGDAVRHRIEEIIDCGEGTPSGHIPFTPRAKRAMLECALWEARQLGHDYIGTEHLLLGLLREDRGLAAEVLADLGADHARVRQQLTRLLSGRRDSESPPAPPDLHRYDEQIAEVRRDKETAVDAGDFDRARAMRSAEKKLLAEKLQRTKHWLASVDVVAVIEEVHRLRGEVERLRDVLRRHGIEPDDGTPQAARARH